MFTEAEILQATGGRLVGAPFGTVSSVSSDSRSITHGQLFVALEGEHFNGHDYIQQALDCGAAACIVSERWAAAQAPVSVLPLVAVTDTLWALGSLAKHYRQRFSIPVIGVTGSNGKTTTKEMIASILSLTGRGLKTSGNLNNLIGLPQMVFQLSGADTWAVFEMGMSELGEIDRLADIASPTIGVVLNAFPAHLASMGTVEAVARAKGELLFKITDGGLAVINADDSRIASLPQNPSARRLSFGINRGEVRAENIVNHGVFGQQFELVTPKGTTSVTLQAPGSHAIYNALAASAATLDLVPLETIRIGLGQFKPYSGRFQIERLRENIILIDDSYNANPASMKAALSTVQEIKEDRTVHLVLGDMLELGAEEHQLHQQLGGRSAHVANHLYLMGTFSKDTKAGAVAAGLEESAITCSVDHSSLYQDLISRLGSNDLILIKGSRGMKMDVIATMLRTAYSNED